MTTSASHWPQLLFATSIAALSIGCTVGDVNGGPGGPAADAAPVAAAWNPLTDKGVTPGNGPFIHYVSDTEIYSVVGGNICMWNGSTWEIIAEPPVDVTLGAQFHFVSRTQIYAFLKLPGNLAQVCMYDGTTWIPKTPEVDALVLNADGAMDVIPGPPEQIYAFIAGNKVCVSTDGADFVDMTGDQLNLNPNAVHVDGANIYAVVGGNVCFSTAPVGGFDNIATPVDAPGLAAFELVSANDFHAVIGRQICRWNGTAWDPITDELPAELGNFAIQGDGYRAAGLDGEVHSWE